MKIAILWFSLVMVFSSNGRILEITSGVKSSTSIDIYGMPGESS